MYKIKQLFLVILSFTFCYQAAASNLDSGGNVITAVRLASQPSHVAAYNVYKPVKPLESKEGVTVLLDYSKGALFNLVPATYFADLIELVTELGHTFESSNQGILNHNLNNYGVIIFDTVFSSKDYSDQEISAIETFVANGGAVLILGEARGCADCIEANANLSKISEALAGITLGVNTLTPTDLYFSALAPHELFDGVSQLYFRYGGALNVSGVAFEIATTNDRVNSLIGLKDKVAVLGDSSFVSSGWSNQYWGKADSITFLENLFSYLTGVENQPEVFGGSVSGCAMHNGEPLVNAKVRLFIVKGKRPPIATERTDEYGCYEFTEVDPDVRYRTVIKSPK